MGGGAFYVGEAQSCSDACMIGADRFAISVEGRKLHLVEGVNIREGQHVHD